MVREAARSVWGALKDVFRSRAGLVAENAVLRQQIIVLQRGKPHSRLRVSDRFTIAAITKLFSAAVDAVTIVRPETVLGWHRSLWNLTWARRSRHRVGRPLVDADTRALIRRLWTENPLWGEDQRSPRIRPLLPWSLPSRPQHAAPHGRELAATVAASTRACCSLQARAGRTSQRIRDRPGCLSESARSSRE